VSNAIETAREDVEAPQPAAERPDARRPPTFQEARNRRQRARAAGMHPDYWYPAEFDKALKPGVVKEVVFWKQSIALFRTQSGEVHAIANRCAHRQLKLSLGNVEGCQLVCPYHGWRYEGDGKVAEFPHETFGKTLKLGVPTYPVRIRYGIIWVFPGDPTQVDAHPIPEIPELEGPNRWACVPFSSTWNAHHSMILENVVDFTHEWLHRKYKPFKDAKLERLDATDEQLEVDYDCQVGRGGLVQHFVDHDGIDTNAMTLGFYYPHQWSDTGGFIRHWMFVLPIDERTTRAFFLFHFTHFKVPFTPFKLPRWMMLPIIKLTNKLVFDPLLAEDGWAVEAEQDAWERHFDMPVAEVNPVIKAMQELSINKWAEHLEQSGGREIPRHAARA